MRIPARRTFRKAITAGLFAAAGTLGGLWADGSTNPGEFLIAGGAGLVAGAATYRVENTDA